MSYESKNIKKKEKNKKSKKILIVFSLILTVIIISSTFLIVNHHCKKIEKLKLEEKLRLEEEHQKLISKTKEDFSFYLDNTPKENLDISFNVFNRVIEENQKNQKINYQDFVKTNLNKINLNDTSKLSNKIDEEIQNYSIDKLELEFSSGNINTNYDKATLEEIFNNHEFIKNKDHEIEKRNNYLNNLNSFKLDLENVKNQSKQFYKSNNIYYTKDDSTLNILKKFSSKYKLDLRVEKEFFVPILCYHGVLDTPWGISSLFVRIKEFESQMKYLNENGFTPLFASEILSAKNYEKPVIITFDDGYRDVYTNAFPILKKYNIKANVYIISGWLGGDVYMTEDMTQEMSNSPLIEIGSHTVNHKGLATLSNEEIEYEVKTSKESLENLLGKSVNVIAYPKGSYDSRVVNVTKKYYTYGLSTNKGKENPSKLNKYTLNRIYVYRGTTLDSFKTIFN